MSVQASDDLNSGRGPSVSVVIPYYNEPKGLAALYEAMTAQRYSDSFRVIVVDDGSALSAADVPWPTALDVQVVRKTNAGPAAARNAGATLAETELIAFIDADCIPHPTWLAGLVSAASAGANVAYSRVYSDTGYPYPMWAAPGGQPFVSASMVVGRGPFFAIGGFDTAFRAYREDTDFALRAMAAGWSLASALDGRVYHPHRRQSLRRVWRSGRLHYDDVLLFKRHGVLAMSDLGLRATRPSALGLSFAGGVASALALAGVGSALTGRLPLSCSLFGSGLFVAAAATFVANRAVKGVPFPTQLANAVAGAAYAAGWYTARIQGSLAHRRLCL